MDRLLAGRVTSPAAPEKLDRPTSVTSHAIKFYSNPSDQNAAATLGASGSTLDVLA